MKRIIFILFFLFQLKATKKTCFEEYFDKKCIWGEKYINLDLIFSCINESYVKSSKLAPQYRNFDLNLQQQVNDLYDSYCRLYFLYKVKDKYEEFGKILLKNYDLYNQANKNVLRKLKLTEKKIKSKKNDEKINILYFNLQKRNENRYFVFDLNMSFFILFVIFCVPFLDI